MISSARAGKAIRILESFDDPAISHGRWDRLLASGPTDTVFLTLDWQREWWRAFGDNQLVLVVAHEADEARTIAPLYSDDGMVFLIGSGESDFLDLIGHVDEPTARGLLAAARQHLAELEGIVLHQVPLESRTTALLPTVAGDLNLSLCRESEIEAPYLDLADEERVRRLLSRREREEKRMRREGSLQVRVAGPKDLDPWLEMFFTQHSARWGPHGTAKFEDERHRAFCQAIVHIGHRAGWVRMTMLEWRGEPVAFDLTLVHRDRNVAWLISRDTSIQRHAPARILQSHIIRAALAGGVRRYEFGIGDQEYKLKHATAIRRLASWALWP